MIERKFNMLSTKEWLQYLQYKLAPERDKEINERLSGDPFLKEAVDCIGDKDNRAVAFQSLTYLIGQIEDATGVSESRVLAVHAPKNYDSTLWKKIAIILAGLSMIGLLGWGIYYIINKNSSDVSEEDMLIPKDTATTSTVSQYIDTSASPLDVIPAGAATVPSIDTTSAKPAPNPSAKPTKPKPTATNSSLGALYPKSQSSGIVASNAAPSAASTPAASSGLKVENAATPKEREQFNTAQEKFKNGDREGARQILQNLKSYDNPMKSQAETILKNMGN